MATLGRLWCVNRLNDNINNSRANGNNHLDNNNGRLVGIVKLNLLGLLSFFILTILQEIKIILITWLPLVQLCWTYFSHRPGGPRAGEK